MNTSRNFGISLRNANVPPDVRQQIEREYGNSAGQKVLLTVPYYSTVRFLAAHAAGPPVVLTIDTTKRTAFSYAQGQPMTSAGFASGANATLAETNLITQSQTRDQADVWIWGIACALLPGSEPALAYRVWRETAIELALNGTSTIPIGTLEMYPGAGGLYGSGNSAIKIPDIPGLGAGAAENGAGAMLSAMSNGNPMAGNFKRFSQAFKWAGVGKGSDSSLGILLTPQRTITETAAAVRAAATGVGAYTPPASSGAPGAFVDVRVQLICVSVGDRGVNV